MEIKITQENQNPLFKRKEIKAVVNTKVVPSNKEVITALSKKFSVSEDAVKIKNILGKFGSQDFEINANIYTSKKELDNTEVKTKKQREAEKKVEEEKRKAKAEAKKKAKEESEKPVEASE
ncbi:hypothetical protein J4481_02355 [Candidatus Pacearchaeota archaeon]|nr:hypothetical protein [Candidatus Pacearchaeota archaeon]